MATLEELVAARELERMPVRRLRRNEFADRELFLAPELIAWMTALFDQEAGSTPDGMPSVKEELYLVMRDFITGVSMSSPKKFKKLFSRPEKYVWEIKTPRFRLFGWFVSFDRLVLVVGESKDVLVQSSGGVPSCIERVCQFRDQISLDEPKYLREREYRYVVSD